MVPGKQVVDPALVDLVTIYGSGYTWTVNVAAGTAVVFKLTDYNRNTSYSPPITVMAGASDACVRGPSGTLTSCESFSLMGVATQPGSAISTGQALPAGSAAGVHHCVASRVGIRQIPRGCNGESAGSLPGSARCTCFLRVCFEDMLVPFFSRPSNLGCPDS